MREGCGDSDARLLNFYTNTHRLRISLTNSLLCNLLMKSEFDERIDLAIERLENCYKANKAELVRWIFVAGVLQGIAGGIITVLGYHLY